MAAKKKTTSTGSPTVDAANAAKKFKAPKDYKPLTTAQKAAMVASVLPAGRVVGTATKTVKAVSKARAGYKVSSKTAQKIGDKISGKTSKKVQSKLDNIANKDVEQTMKNNPGDSAFEAWVWSKHPALVSGKGYNRAITKGKTVTDRQSVRYRKAEDKAVAKANARGLKAANKPTRASKNPEIKASKNIADAEVALKNRSRIQADWEGQKAIDSLRKRDPKAYKKLMNEFKKSK